MYALLQETETLRSCSEADNLSKSRGRLLIEIIRIIDTVIIQMKEILILLLEVSGRYDIEKDIVSFYVLNHEKSGMDQLSRSCWRCPKLRVLIYFLSRDLKGSCLRPVLLVFIETAVIFSQPSSSQYFMFGSVRTGGEAGRTKSIWRGAFF